MCKGAISRSNLTLASALGYCCRSCPQALTHRSAAVKRIIADGNRGKYPADGLEEELRWYVIGDQLKATWATHLICHVWSLFLKRFCTVRPPCTRPHTSTNQFPAFEL